MRWPWVSRTLHEAVVAELHRAIDRGELHRAEGKVVNDRLLQRVDELMGEIIRMRREGFVPQPEPPRQDEAKPMPEKVVQAIEERGANAAMRRQLMVYAERRLRDGIDETELAEIIMSGEQFEEEFV